MKKVLLAVKVTFILAYFLIIAHGSSIILSLSISGITLILFLIFLAYPAFLTIKSFFVKEDVEKTKKIFKQSLIVSLIFTVIGLILSVYDYKNGGIFIFFVFVIIGLILVFFCAAILMLNKLSFSQNAIPVSNVPSPNFVDKHKQLALLLILMLIAILALVFIFWFASEIQI